MSPREAAGRDPQRSTLPLGALALNVGSDKDRGAGCWRPQRRRRRVRAMATAAPPRPDARDIFGEVVESLVHERPLAETLGLISRRGGGRGAPHLLRGPPPPPP